MGSNASRTRILDLGFLALAVAGVAEALATMNADPVWARVAFVPLWTLPLLLKQQARVAGHLMAFAALAAESAVAPHTVPGAVTPFLALFAAFARAGHAPRARSAVGGLFFGLGAVALILYDEPTFRPSDLFVPTVLGAVAWAAGKAIRNREQRAALSERRVVTLEAQTKVERRAAVVEERGRIARELHDLIAHSLSVVIVQAVAALELAEDERASERLMRPLHTIETTSREALAEMRRMLGILADDNGGDAAGATQLANFESLAERMREAGLHVVMSVEGEHRSVGPGVALSAYRIVQEALTNVLKHGGRNTVARVRVVYSADAIDLDVDDDGRGEPAGDLVDTGGHGLVNMRERTALFGGTFEASAKPNGGYRVRARLPLGAVR